MTDVKMLDEKVKPMKEISELKDGLNLPKHMAEHIYMFGGPSAAIQLKTTADMMTELTDWFGTDFTIMKQKGEEITIRLICNENAMRYWSLQYGPYVEVLKPESLRNKIREDVQGMYRKYLG